MQRLALAVGVLLVLAIPLFAVTPEEEDTVQAVAKVRPAVVNIYTLRMVEARLVDPVDLYFERFFGGGFSRGNRIVRKPVRNLGSGLIVSSDGYIVTNNHIVERANEGLKIQVNLSDGRDFEARVLRVDPDIDLALLKIIPKEKKEGEEEKTEGQEQPPEGLEPEAQGEEQPEEGKEESLSFPFHDLSELSPNLLGQTVIVIGNPVGYESSVSRGILSAKGRTLNLGVQSMDGLLQTDAAINPGNSGGPLIDISGKLVGLSTAKMAMTPGGPGTSINVENIGFAVPADRVKAFVEDSIAIAEGRKEPPPEIPLTTELRRLFGLDVQELTPELAKAFGYRGMKGLLVSNVEPGSPAEKAGIDKGMLLVGIGPYRLRSADDLPRRMTAIESGTEVKLAIVFLVQRGPMVAVRNATVTLTAR